MTAQSVLPHLHRCLWHSLCSIGLQLLKDLAHAFPSPEACCSSEAIAVLLVGIDCCQVIKLCAVESTQILIVGLRYAPLACAIGHVSEILNMDQAGKYLFCMDADHIPIVYGFLRLARR